VQDNKIGPDKDRMSPPPVIVKYITDLELLGLLRSTANTESYCVTTQSPSLPFGLSARTTPSTVMRQPGLVLRSPPGTPMTSSSCPGLSGTVLLTATARSRVEYRPARC